MTSFNITSFCTALPLQRSYHHAGEQRAFPLSLLLTGSDSGSARGLRPAEEPAGGEHHRRLQTGTQQQKQRHKVKRDKNHDVKYTSMHSEVPSEV